MLIVANHPLRRQRHAVTSEIPASRQNLCRLMMGLPSNLMVDMVLMRQCYVSHPFPCRHRDVTPNAAVWSFLVFEVGRFRIRAEIGIVGG